MTSTVTQELIIERRLERVPIDIRRTNALLREAAQHVVSARALADQDPQGAYTLVYDALRKAIVGHMAAEGIRPTSAQGAHAAVMLYAEAELVGVVDPGVLADLDRMRRTRNRAEYDARPIGEQELTHDIGLVNRIVQAVIEEIAARGKELGA
jgi:hypothetical protein